MTATNLREEWKELRSDVGDVRESMAGLLARCEGCRADRCRLLKTVYGNGSGGLVAKVFLLLTVGGGAWLLMAAAVGTLFAKVIGGG